MAWWNRKTETRTLRRGTVPSAMLGAGDAGEPAALSPNAAMRLAEVYGCVRLLVHAAVPLPLKTYRADAERVSDGTLPRLLDRPWPGATTPDLIGSVLTSLLLCGDAFIGIYVDGAGAARQLGVLPPDAVTVKLDGDRIVYTLMTRQGVATLSERDVIHVRSPLAMPGELRGMSPVRWLASSMGEAQALARFGARTVEHASKPGLVVTMDREVKADQEKREALRDEIASRYSGPENVGRPLILGGGVSDVKVLTASLVDMEFIRHRELAAGAIARAFGVPASLLDLPANGSLTYSNAESRSADLLRYALEAWLVAIERTITAHQLARGVSVRFDRRALLRPDTPQRAEVYERAVTAGWMTVDEVRAAEDLPRLTGTEATNADT